jgi:hypothetical protein
MENNFKWLPKPFGFEEILEVGIANTMLGREQE